MDLNKVKLELSSWLPEKQSISNHPMENAVVLGVEAIAWAQHRIQELLEANNAYLERARDAECALAAAVATIPEASPPVIRVKPLVWSKGVVDYANPLPGMRYISTGHARDGSWSWFLDGENDTRGVLPSEAEAKAAAQADYEARILSALESEALP
jgi:hypothetical protein